jgi:hypothetical protein
MGVGVSMKKWALVREKRETATAAAMVRVYMTEGLCAVKRSRGIKSISLYRIANKSWERFENSE